MGPARAKRLIMLTEKVLAGDAVAWGLADKIVGAGDATGAAREMALRAVSMPNAAMRMCKQSINAYANALAHVATHADHDQFALAQNSDDAQEQVRAFLEDR